MSGNFPDSEFSSISDRNKRAKAMMRKPGYYPRYGVDIDSTVLNQAGNRNDSTTDNWPISGRVGWTAYQYLAMQTRVMQYGIRAADPGDNWTDFQTQGGNGHVGTHLIHKCPIHFVQDSHNTDTPARGWSRSSANIASRKALMKAGFTKLKNQPWEPAIIAVSATPQGVQGVDEWDSTVKDDYHVSSQLLAEIADELDLLAFFDIANDPQLRDDLGMWKDAAYSDGQAGKVHLSDVGFNAVGASLKRQWDAAKLPTSFAFPNVFGGALSDASIGRHQLVSGGVFGAGTGAPSGWSQFLTAPTYNARIAPVDGDAFGHWQSLTVGGGTAGMFQNMSVVSGAGSTEFDPGDIVRIHGRFRGDGGVAIIKWVSGPDYWIYVRTDTGLTGPGNVLVQDVQIPAGVSGGQFRIEFAGSGTTQHIADLGAINLTRMGMVGGLNPTQFYPDYPAI